MRIRSSIGEYAGLIAALALVVGFFGLKAPHFFTIETFKTIANQIPDAIFLVSGMTLVLVTGGIDLSVGSVLGISGVMIGCSLGQWHLGVGFSVAVGLVTGALCGLVNGWVTTRWVLPSFIVTLGMLEMARGGAYLVSGSQTAYVGGPIERIADASVLGLSVPFILALLAVAGTQIALSCTVFGRYATAIGTNEKAARLSGIDPRPTKVLVFTIAGAFAATAAVMNVSRLASADPNAGSGFELQAIAAAVIGGTSLMGGRGTAIGSFLGVLIMALLENGLAQIGAQEPVKRLVTGAVIVVAVVFDRYRSRRAALSPSD